MSAQPIVCSNCGASLSPRALETRLKCQYCETSYTIVRDHEGVTGLSPEGKPGAGAPGAAGAPGSATAAASASGSPQVAATPAANMFQTPFGGIPVPQDDTMRRLEQDAVLAVRGLEALERTAEAAKRGGCVVLFAIGLLALSVIAAASL